MPSGKRSSSGSLEFLLRGKKKKEINVADGVPLPDVDQDIHRLCELGDIRGVKKLLNANTFSPEQLEQLEKLFKKHAVSKKINQWRRETHKVLDLDCFKRICKSMGCILTATEAKAVFQEVDTDGSGDVDYDEFMELMKGQMLMNADKLNRPNSMGETPLWLMCRQGDKEGVAQVLKAGADVNLAGPDGVTALHAASSLNRHEAVKLLLEAKADPNKQDFQGRTPLHHDCSGSVLMLRLFESADADLSIADNAGRTVIHNLALHGLWPPIAELVQKDPSVLDQQDNAGLTPLHIASRCGFKKLVPLFVEFGASLRIKDKEGRKPSELAVDKGTRAAFAQYSKKKKKGGGSGSL